MQRNIRISFFVLYFILSDTGIKIIDYIQQAFQYIFYILKAGLNAGFPKISSELFKSNHSKYLKDAAYQNYLEKVAIKVALLGFGQPLINH
jgi:hypothetical protein